MNATMIFQMVLGIVSVVMTVVAIPLIHKKVKKEDILMAMNVVDTAVKAAEQIFHETGKGAIKKEYVKKYIRDRKINISEKDLDAMIEASVLELNRWREELEK